jgi:hypothetical protein
VSATDAETTALSEGQYDDAYPPGIERHFWHVARNATIATELARCGMDRLPLLEIGCGRGIIVDYLKTRGLDCIGCDPATPKVEARLAASVFTGTDFRDLPAERRRGIRGALLCDVIEHIAEQGELLREVVRGLPALTHVLVTVPARSELWSDWDVHYGHFRRYDRRMLALEIEGAGLELLSMRYFLHALYAPMLLARGRRRTTTITAPGMTPLHRLIGAAFMLEERVVPSWVPGTSLLAVARVR